MRRETTPGGGAADVFKGVKLSEYTPGRKVVVQTNKGKWEERELEIIPGTTPSVAAVVEGNKLKVKLAGVGEKVLNEPPDFFEFNNSGSITDPKLVGGAPFTLDAPQVTERGTVEYDVTGPGGKVKRVAQELLKGWQDVIKLEGELNVLEAQINGLSGDKQLELAKKVGEAKKMLNVLAAALPEDLGAMAAQSGKAVADIEKKFSDLHKDAAEAIRALTVQKDMAALATTPAVAGATAGLPKYHLRTAAGKDETEVAPPGKVEFSFENTAQELVNGVTAFLDNIPKEDDKVTPKPEYAALFIKVMKLLGEPMTGLIDNSKGLMSLEQAKALAYMPAAADEAALRTAREALLTNKDNELKILIAEFEAKKAGVAAPVAQEQGEMAAIDFSESLLTKLLAGKQDKVKEAMKGMYKGKGADAFKEIFDGAPAATPAELRKAGIKDWKVFKQLWDDKLAAQTAAVMEEAAKKTIQRKVAEYIDSLEGKWEQIKTVKGQLLTRAGVNAALIGGAQLGISKYIHLSSEWMVDLTRAGAGGFSGLVKHGTGKVLLNAGGDSSWNASNQRSLEALRVGQEGKLIDSLINDTSLSPPGAAPVAPPPGKGFFGRLVDKIVKPSAKKQAETQRQKEEFGGIKMFTRVVGQTVRDQTAGKIEVDGVELAGNARLRYERVLASIETKDPEEARLIALAQVLSEMNRLGDNQIAGLVGAKQPPTPNYLDKYLGYYAGRGSWKGSVATNAVVSAVFFSSGSARLAFGGFLGAVMGWKAGEALRLSREKESAKKTIVDRIKKVRGFTVLEEATPGSVTGAGRKAFYDELIGLKRFMHGNLPAEELSAAIDFGVDKAGSPVQRVDELLLQQIESVVYDAEKTDILLEKAEDKANLEKVLAAMQQAGVKMVEEQHIDTWPALLKWMQKQGYRVGGALAGATAMAGAFWAGGMLVGKAMKGIQDHFGWGRPEAVAAGAIAGGVRGAAMDHPTAGGVTHEVHSGAGVEHLGGKDGLTQFLEHHHLGPRSEGALKDLVKEYPSLGKDPQSLERILAASRVGEGVHSAAHPDAIRGAIDTFDEGGGSRRLAIFDELTRQGDKAGALKFLESEHLSSSHFAHLKHLPHDLKGVVDHYDPHNSGHTRDLFEAFRGRESTDLANAGFEQDATATTAGRDVHVKGEVNYFGVRGQELVMSGGNKGAGAVMVETMSPAGLAGGDRFVGGLTTEGELAAVPATGWEEAAGFGLAHDAAGNAYTPLMSPNNKVLFLDAKGVAYNASGEVIGSRAANGSFKFNTALGGKGVGEINTLGRHTDWVHKHATPAGEHSRTLPVTHKDDRILDIREEEWDDADVAPIKGKVLKFIPAEPEKIITNAPPYEAQPTPASASRAPEVLQSLPKAEPVPVKPAASSMVEASVVSLAAKTGSELFADLKMNPHEAVSTFQRMGADVDKHLADINGKGFPNWDRGQLFLRTKLTDLEARLGQLSLAGAEEALTPDDKILAQALSEYRQSGSLSRLGELMGGANLKLGANDMALLLGSHDGEAIANGGHLILVKHDGQYVPVWKPKLIFTTDQVTQQITALNKAGNVEVIKFSDAHELLEGSGGKGAVASAG